MAWHPEAGPGPSSVALGSGAADGTACLWTAQGKLLHQLRGHTQRLGRVAFHPAGAHFGTASFDGTWRLWDVDTGDCLLEQEGHSRAVYALAFHPDGSLAASAGLDAHGQPFSFVAPCLDLANMLIPGSTLSLAVHATSPLSGEGAGKPPHAITLA